MKLKSILHQCSKRNIASFIFIFSFVFNIAQNKGLEQYIPYEKTSLLTNPPVTLKVKLHLIYRYENDAQNYNLDSLKLIKNQFSWINGFYGSLDSCTTEAQDGKKHYIKDSRIRFRLDTVLKHVDSALWNRRYINLHNKVITIDSIFSTENTLYIANKYFGRLRNVDSVKIDKNNYKLKSINKKNGRTVVVLQNFPKKEDVKNFRYYIEKDLNCDRFIWEKYSDSDKNYIHIFFTGSSLNGVAFGCGPKPYFLNISNLVNGGGWGLAQLIAHELGHTIGLRHTNNPQFDDLPATDKFGFINCNSKTVSNNIMGYNKCRRYLSPKQVGFVHKLYTTKPNRVRITTANEYKEENTFDIWYDTVWNKEMIVTGDIIVRKGRTLTIHKNVHLSENTTIYVEKKAKLLIDKAILSNYFDTKWKGIIICKSAYKPSKNVRLNKNKGIVEIRNKGAIEEALRMDL